jgi:pantoate--beta-alanine ligase
LIIIKNIAALQEIIAKQKSESKSIGFVPTMGALHLGHLTIIKKAAAECDFCVVSIFVNPTQFNNKEDFNRYPITIEKDIKLLEQVDCDLLFLPEVEEIYTSDFIMPKYEIGKINELMEGKFRPGHFQGVVQVVYRLFDIVKPDKAFFGLKDFQQLTIIKKMVQHFSFKIDIIPCETVRDDKGLALSSRNLLLNEVDKQKAYSLYQSLLEAKELCLDLSPNQVKQEIQQFYKNLELDLEYFEIIDSENFEILEEKWVKGAVACVVVKIGQIRLIDNMQIN